MWKYYLNGKAQPNGDHEVHKDGCVWLPAPENRIDLGMHTTCQSAVREAAKYRQRVNGCKWCSAACHTG